MDFIITNFAVICVSIILSITLIRKYKTQRRTCFYLLVILAFTLIITILDYAKNYAQYTAKDLLATTILGSVLYVVRPCCILLFLLLSEQKFKSALFFSLLALTGLNIIVCIFPFFDATRELAFYYTVGDTGEIHWGSGNIMFFRYFPHIVSIIYLAFLVYKSVSLLKRKHLADAMGILVCFAVVSIATVLETFFNDDGSVYLLPTSIVISAIFFYIFLYERNMKIDSLTGLFNRSSYFADLSKFNKDVTGIIQLDMNGLKYLNDNCGHIEGDKGLKRIAEAISNNITNKMYAYRLGGDEFIVIAVNESEENIFNFVVNFKEELKSTLYYCSVGYAYRSDKNSNVDELFKISEQEMYKDKADFYKTGKIERRKNPTGENN